MAIKQLLSQILGPTSVSIGHVLLASTVILLAYNVVVTYRDRDRSRVPVVGWISPVLPKLASLWYILNQKVLLDKAYDKVSIGVAIMRQTRLSGWSVAEHCTDLPQYLKHGVPCRIPDFAFGPSIVLLPLSELRWVISQPQSVLDFMKTQDDSPAQLRFIGTETILTTRTMT